MVSGSRQRQRSAIIDADNAPDVLSADFSAGSQGLKSKEEAWRIKAIVAHNLPNTTAIVLCISSKSESI
jgi:hypothetical protein